MRRIRRVLHPVMGLFWLSPLCGEFLTGSLPVVLLPAVVALAPLYGGGALLVRETARRRGLGWPAILVLALAYALVEEGLLTQSLFDPDYAGEHLLRPGFVPWLGTGLPWAVFVLSLHVAASMAAPIALVESCARGRSRSPWLHRRGLAVTAAVYLLGCAITVALNRAMRGDHPFSAPWPRLLCVAGLAALLVAAVVLAPRRRDAGGTGRGRGAGVAPAPAVVAVAVGVAATLVVWPGAALTAVGPWWTPAIGVAAWLVVALLLARWSRGVGWGQRHVAAAATGIVAAFAASLLQKGAVTSQWPLAIATDLILLAGLAWVVRTAWRRAGSATAPAPPLQAGRAQSRDIRSDGRSEPSPPFS